MARIPVLVWYTAIFLFSRAVYYIAGIRFDVNQLATAWQNIDPVLMRTDLLRSLWYLHMQPPGFNFLEGLSLKLFPDGYPAFWTALYLVTGWVIGWALWWLLEHFGVNRRLALTITVLFMISPGVVLYENFLIYEYPIILLLLLAAVALFRFVEHPTFGRSIAFFAALGALMYIRNLFHLVYLLLVVAGLWWTMKPARRVIAVGATPAFLCNLALYVKNWFLFGTFAASTWAGMATGVVTTTQMRPDEVEPMIAAGDLTPFARIVPFSELSEYASYISMPAQTGIPILDNPNTSTGHPNYNHLGYLQVHQAYAANAVTVIRNYPKAYARAVAISWFAYFLPLSDLHTFDKMRQPIERFDRVWSAFFYGQFLRPEKRNDLRGLRDGGRAYLLPFYTGVFLIILVPALNVWAGWRLWQQWRGRGNMTAAQATVWAFAWLTLVFVTLVSNSLSSFESNRYRFPLDGFYLLFLGTALDAWWKSRKKTV